MPEIPPPVQNTPAVSSAPTTYDSTPYSVNAFPQTHPNRLAVLAHLFGLDAPRPDRCRVLELGCASGGNLIPMALLFPQSQFTGIDLSQRQIAEGQAIIRELSLTNITLRHMSILDAPPEPCADFGPFDYILAHGVYSWVPAAVQSRILDICHHHLTPQGVAYISYNTYPGWHARGAIREMLCYHTESFPSDADRIQQARALLSFLATTIPAGDSAYSALLRQELSLLQRTPDTYLLHEHLEDFNEPLYFHQFANRAAEHGLQYLAEAQIAAMLPTRFGPEAEKTLRSISPDLLHMEQYMDFLRNRMFRQSLLCHADAQLNHSLRPDAVQNFYIASSAKPTVPDCSLTSDQPQTYTAGGSLVKFETHDPLMKAAMVEIAESWPLSVDFETLLTRAHDRLKKAGGNEAAGLSPDSDALALRLLNCYTTNLVEFALTHSAFSTTVGERPIASPYARLRARHGDKVTNLRLETVPLAEPARLILSHLDGTHDRVALAALVTTWLEQHPTSEGSAQIPTSTPAEVTLTPAQRAARYLDHVLQAFATAALLVDTPECGARPN